MKTAVLLAAASLFLVSSVFAQSSPPPAQVPPPPGIDAPGVQAVAAPPTDKPAGKRSVAAGLPSMQDPGTPGDGKHMTLPEVSKHREGDNEVQEYRRGGMLYMVVVTPKHGIPQVYNVDPDGSRHLQQGHAPVRPVMYKVLEWGKSKPAKAEAAEPAPAASGP
jgi:hypothetical protein